MTYERGTEPSISVIDLSSAELPKNAKINDLFYIKKGGVVDGVTYQDNSILITKKNTKEINSPSSFEYFYEQTPASVVVVNSVYDLPEPVDMGEGLGLVYSLIPNKTYIIDGISLEYPIVMNNNTLTGNWASPLNFTGTGAMFRNNSIAPIGISRLINLKMVGNNINTFLDISGGGVLTIDDCFCMNFAGSSVQTDYAYIRDTTIGEQSGVFNWDVGIVLYWNGILQYTSHIIIDSLNNIEANSATISMKNVEIIPISGDSAFYINPLFSGRMSLGRGGGVKVSYGGIPFKTGSLTQESPRISVVGFTGVSDSQVIGSFYMERNSTVTNITETGVTKNFTAISDAGGGKCLVTCVAHGLTNGTIIWLIDTDYSGMYVISDVLTDSFQIVSAFDGTSNGLVETGWVKISGTTLPMENERVSMTANNELTFTNLDEHKVIVNSVCNVRNESSTANKSWEFSVMKNGIRLKGSVSERQMTNKVGTTPCLCTTSVTSGDKFSVYTRNLTDTTNMVAENISIIIQ